MKNALIVVALFGLGCVVGGVATLFVTVTASGYQYHKALLGDKKSIEAMNKLNEVGENYIIWRESLNGRI